MSDQRFVSVGPFRLYDGDQRDISNYITVLAGQQPPVIACGVHVDALNRRSDREYLKALSQVDVVYADGMSIVLLARLAGAKRLRRTVTTDLSEQVVSRLSSELGRPLRLFFLGGEPGLAQAAGQSFCQRTHHEFAGADHGYQQDWSRWVGAHNKQCDVAFVGLGSPLEVHWVLEYAEQLGCAVLLTCGGWFRIEAGTQKRAPVALRQVGLEWTWRLVEEPRRVWRRYARGLASSLYMACSLVAGRIVARRRAPS
jgi:exopolysaccharide biosynthesis WecB/TagA/CpsF family protein